VNAKSYRSILLLLPVILMAGCATVDFSFLFDPECTRNELQTARGRTSNKIAIVDISGVIRSGMIGGPLFDADFSPETIQAVLNEIEYDSHIKAVMLRIDTPGGEVTAADIIYNDVKRFKARTGIPVYVAMMGLTCSGGYYVAMAADRIYAHPTTVTGSIGVIAHFT
jgi:protease-4